MAAPTRPLTKKPVVTLAEIAENDVIITNQQFYFSDMSNEYTKNTLAYLIKPRFDLWNPIAATELAKLDCGIALLASYLVEDAVKKVSCVPLMCRNWISPYGCRCSVMSRRQSPHRYPPFISSCGNTTKSEIIWVESKPPYYFF